MIEVHGSPAPPPAPSGTAPSRRRRAWLALVALAVAAGALGVPIYAEIRARATSDANLRRATDEVAVPIVNVVRPRPGAVAEELVLPGNTQAYTDAPIYARTSGYLRRWYFDLGARVKRGDLLAEIDAPEVDRQLQQARADLQNAEANLHQAEITAQRWQALLESQAVSQQETDQAVNTLRAMKATVASSAANVQRLEELKAFQRINAPFDGVITARRTDVGALIDAGANTQGQELFHISAIDRLRVFIAVPQVYSQAARPGAKARLTLAELPGQSFPGTLVRTANAIDPAARTLLTEVEVANPTEQLLPGAYVLVHLQLPRGAEALVLPVNTLMFRGEGLRVAVVKGGQATLVPVTISRDDGTTIEVVSGLRATDEVILDPPDSLVSGTPVRVKEPAPAGRGSP